MENGFHNNPQQQSSEFSVPKAAAFDWENSVTDREIQDTVMRTEDDGDDEESLAESMVCGSGAGRLVPGGFTRPTCTEDYIMFLNAGEEINSEVDSRMGFATDAFFDGGDVMRTGECITEAGDYPFIYESVRLGNCCYQFDDITPGDYFVDLHFAEIINTNGPKGMRVFNVFMQNEKVLSNFDIFSIVGANRPLQLVDSRVSVKDDKGLVIRFEGVQGNPVISGICVRKAKNTSDSSVVSEYLKCGNCSYEIEIPAAEKKLKQAKSTAKYEKKIDELTMQCKRKTDECYEAWMSLTAANEQLEKIKMDLDTKMIHTHSLDQTMRNQAENLKNLSRSYEHDKKIWAAAVNGLAEKVKIMKKEHVQLSREAHECTDSIPELNNMVAGVQALVQQCEDLKVKYSEEQAKRRKLYNEVQEAKGNIRVFCRCRPLTKEERSVGCATAIDFDAAKDGSLGIVAGSSSKKTFKFDRVYTPSDNQANVFADASPMVISVLDGYNICIFAYGQTGTGKTFTMEGTEQNRGVNYRTLELLFKIAEERCETYKYDISVSVLEVYNEQIRDLLATSPSSKKLEIKQASEGSHHVPGVVEAKVENIGQVWSVLQAGSNARAVGSNNVNEHSSRSHCLLCIVVRAKNLMNGECTRSKLWLVDLAGSERLAKTDVQGERLKEAQNINKSLSALGDVVSALAAKSSHIPYRNSKLTHLLQDSLGGDSKTLMFVQISPSDRDMSETLGSLNFATRVRGVELGPVRKQIDPNELQKIKQMLDKSRQESRSKDEVIRKLEETLQNLESKTKSKDHGFKTQQEKIKELEGQLEMKTNMRNQTEQQISQLSERLKSREETCSSLQEKVKELERQLRARQQSESASFQQKIKDLENKLQKQEEDSKSCSSLYQDKIKELERKLKEQEEHDDSLLHKKIKELERKLKLQEEHDDSILQKKIKELEDKLKDQENHPNCTLNNDLNEITGATPNVCKTDTISEVPMEDAEPHILRSSNSMNCSIMRQGSVKRKGAEIVQETRRRRESRIGLAENSILPRATVNNNKIRKSDPPRVARLVRATKPAITTTQGTFTNKRIPRDPVQGIKERDRTKIWMR